MQYTNILEYVLRIIVCLSILLVAGMTVYDIGFEPLLFSRSYSLAIVLIDLAEELTVW